MEYRQNIDEIDIEEEAALVAVPQPISHPIPVSATIRTQTGDEKLETIKKGFAALAESDGLDKAHALELTRLFHSMETLVLREIHLRERDVAELRTELEMTRLRSELDRLARRQTVEAFQAQQISSVPSRKR